VKSNTRSAAHKNQRQIKCWCWTRSR